MMLSQIRGMSKIPWLLSESELRECRKCHEDKPVDGGFRVRTLPSGKLWLSTTCRDCELAANRAWHQENKRDRSAWRAEHSDKVKKYNKVAYSKMTDEQKKLISRRSTLAKYGLTPEDYQVMFDMQDGKCSVCQRTPEGNGVSRHNLVVDHDHDTGQVRALLCDFCNRGLGIFRDDPDLLMHAADYLLTYREDRVV